jgi:hypothetical protein
VPAVAPRAATPVMKDAVTRVEITIENGEPLEKVRRRFRCHSLCSSAARRPRAHRVGFQPAQLSCTLVL